jgi:hypothetical protein
MPNEVIGRLRAAKVIGRGAERRRGLRCAGLAAGSPGLAEAFGLRGGLGVG